MMRNRWGLLTSAIGLLAVVVCFSFSGIAGTKDPPWVAKDWAQWTNDDCNIVLSKSPWAQNTSSPGFASTSGPKVGASLLAIVELRSALPARQAVLRQLQLENRYNKLKADKKQVFDQTHAHDLEPDDKVLVDIENDSLTSMPPAGTGSLYQAEQTPPPTQVALRLPDGALIQPIETTILKNGDYMNETQYSFPRTVGGKPLLSQNDTFLVVELGANFDKKTGKVDPQMAFRDSGMGYRFKIADLMYKGKLEY